MSLFDEMDLSEDDDVIADIPSPQTRISTSQCPEPIDAYDIVDENDCFALLHDNAISQGKVVFENTSNHSYVIFNIDEGDGMCLKKSIYNHSIINILKWYTICRWRMEYAEYDKYKGHKWQKCSPKLSVLCIGDNFYASIARLVFFAPENLTRIKNDAEYINDIDKDSFKSAMIRVRKGVNIPFFQHGDVPPEVEKKMQLSFLCYSGGQKYLFNICDSIYWHDDSAILCFRYAKIND